MAKTYNIFISHSWSYGDAYTKLTAMLDSASYFSYKNHSIPKDNPVHLAPSNQALKEAIKNKMHGCHVILIMAGMYSNYSKWINEEILIANNSFLTPKPIIAINPFASKRTSLVVKENADLVVAWNTNSIISGIRQVGLTPL
ncbi:TIR domain-containing protein [Marinicella sp. W31]|uniref:TIR domain-containing protein n=1 Tax=Marinicella sp. W31 TaxID=3023713 RepID=UPI0037575552